MAVVPKVCCASPSGSVTCSQVIRGYMSVMAALKYIYFCNKEYCFIKNNGGTPLIGDVYFVWSL
jgi:hypothetical protein